MENKEIESKIKEAINKFSYESEKKIQGPYIENALEKMSKNFNKKREK